MRHLLLIIVLLCSPAWAAWGTATGTCVAADETSDTAIPCTIATANMEAGNVGVCWGATDNIATTDGQTTDLSITDSGSNTWTRLGEFTNTNGAAADGAITGVFASKLTTQLTSGSSTITLNTTSAVTDKAVRCQEFTIGVGNVLSVVGAIKTEASAADAGSLTTDTIASGEYLFLRGVGAESNAVLSMTATASYTRIGSDGCDGTTGGGEATDIATCGEFRILTATSDTSNPTLVDTTNDNASVYLALKEAAPPAGVPRRRPIEWR